MMGIRGMNDITMLNRAADNIRILSAAMVENAGSGHPGGAMGGADFMNVLYTEFIEYDPQNPEWESRDRFFLDPGHMSPMLYSTLALTGKFTIDDLRRFRQWGSVTPGHPERNVARGVENTSGPLGQGHTFAVGAAIAAKFLKHRLGDVMDHTIYAYISDGGIQEEISQGAGRIAGHLGLDNLIMFYDSNGIQLSTKTDEVTSEDVEAKYRAWGWHVIMIDGHDVSQIRAALNEAKAEKEKPVLIIGTTIMGKGVCKQDGSSFEGVTATHGQPLSAAGACFETTVKKLGGDPNDPFAVFPETKELYERRAAELKEIVVHKKAKRLALACESSELDEKLAFWFSGEFPVINWENIVQKPNQATRAASSTVLSVLAQEVENMIVSSADLSNSDKTDGFLKYTRSIQKGDFEGKFLQAGVSELTMACLSIGMSLHGGVISACATFFVFSDYMKPAVRMAALMEVPVKFIWTHDTFRVGEDGPTHEPVEHEAQIRLLEKLQNHSDENAMLVLRPADAAETTVAWEMAMKNAGTPSALLLSRQNIKDLPSVGQAGFEAVALARKGAYIVSEDPDYDIILLASGSEVSTLVDAAGILKEKGIRSRIVSVPSEGVFRKQDMKYQQMILPEGKKRFGLTAGLPVTLEGLVGSQGKIWGLNSFGFSAPYTVLDEKLGFTAAQVAHRIGFYCVDSF